MPNAVVKRASFKIKEVLDSGKVAIQYHMTGNALWIYTIGLEKKVGSEVFSAFYVAPNTEIQTLEFAKNMFYSILSYSSDLKSINRNLGTTDYNYPITFPSILSLRDRKFILVRPDVTIPLNMSDCEFYFFRVYEAAVPYFKDPDKKIPMLQLLCSDVDGNFPFSKMISNDFYACNQILLHTDIISGAAKASPNDFIKRQELFFRSVQKENEKLGFKKQKENENENWC